MKNSNTNNSIQVLLAKFMSHSGIPRSNLKLFYILFCSLIAGLDYISESHIRSIRTSWDAFVAPLKVEGHKLTHIPNLINNLLAIKHENDALRRELDSLKMAFVKANERIREFNEIKENLGIQYNSERFNVVEKVLGFEVSAYNSYIIISRTNANMSEDEIAITPDGIVGVISAVYEKSAKILPITNSLIAIPVKTNSGIHLIIKGTDKNEMVSLEIQQHDAISSLTVGEILYTSGEGGFYEKGIPVAKITNVNPNTATIHAIPVAQISDINYVWIINSNK